MHDDKGVRIVSVTDELDWLVRRDYTPRNLAMMQVTRELARVEPSLLPVRAGCEVDRYLVKAISTMDGCEFLGRRYEAIPIRLALRLQIGKNRGDLNIQIGRAHV